MDKAGIVRILDEMGTLLELQGANPFKSRAFQNAARAVEGITSDLGELIASGELLEVRGVGKAISVIIKDLHATGASAEYRELRKSFPDGVVQMLSIPGLGPKKVKAIYEKLKISSLEDLEKAIREDRVAELDGFGKKTQDNILRGLQALRTRSDRVLYPKARTSADRIFDDLRKERGVIRAEVAGSLRRRKEVIGDIDIVVSAKAKDCKRLMDVFVKHPDVTSIVAQGETKSSVVLEGGINCDLRIVEDKEFAFALNYFTGSKEHNVEMRSRARKIGWSLNEYGFSNLDAEETRGKAKQVVQCKTESDLYKALGLRYVEPELRENLGEIEAAENGKLPRLIEEKDIRGTFHCHTTYSDGANSIEEMAKAAQALGWEYFGVADHSKAAAYARGLSDARVKEQVKEIDALNARLKNFRLFKGTECDILPNGDLDWSEKTLSLFEYVVISVHSSFKMTEAEMTKRVIKALKHKRTTMLGHPTGRLLLSRDGYPVDMIKVIDAASDYGKIIEINSHPSRFDLDWRLCKYAREKEVMLAVNPDAHSASSLSDVFFGVGIARKGWLEAKNVLNTRSTQEVTALFDRK